MINLSKLGQLAKNAVLPGGGTGLVLGLAFGFGWWLVPIVLIVGGATSLVISKPKQLALPSAKKD